MVATTITAIAAVVAVIDATWNQVNPEPYHNSILTGRGWVQELLDGHRDRMKDSLAFRPPIFRRLERELISRGHLSSGRHIDTTERLAIFLYQATTNNSVRATAERFQRSNETVSKCVQG